MKKRLLKDLPFRAKGAVITKGNGRYYINLGETARSSNGQGVFDRNEEAIIDLIWENSEWMEEATVDNLIISAQTDQITIKFKPLDLEEAQCLAKGIAHNLEKHWGNYQAENKVWYSNFKGFTTTVEQ